jgi:putative membrane protein
VSQGEPAPGEVAAHFAWLQARMAVERTLLAWVRTAVSLIVFGFAIVQFFEAQLKTPGVAPPWRPGGARFVGVSLVGIGTLAMTLATVQYLAILRFLHGEPFRRIAGFQGVPHFRAGLSVALVLTAVGAITLWELITRLPR